jgi:hypothetical protein
VALMQRAGQTTNWLWSNPVPLIDALPPGAQSLSDPQAANTADESSQLR